MNERRPLPAEGGFNAPEPSSAATLAAIFGAIWPAQSPPRALCPKHQAGARIWRLAMLSASPSPTVWAATL